MRPNRTNDICAATFAAFIAIQLPAFASERKALPSTPAVQWTEQQSETVSKETDLTGNLPTRQQRYFWLAISTMASHASTECKIDHLPTLVWNFPAFVGEKDLTQLAGTAHKLMENYGSAYSEEGAAFDILKLYPVFQVAFDRLIENGQIQCARVRQIHDAAVQKADAEPELFDRVREAIEDTDPERNGEAD